MDEGSGTALANAIGSVDASLSGATWATDSTAVGGYKTVYDGVDNFWETDSPLSLNSTAYSAMTWVEFDDTTESGPWVLSCGDPTQIDNGWLIQQVTDGLRAVHLTTGGASFNSSDTISGIDTNGQRYFTAISATNDQGTIYAYDDASQIGSVSFDLTRSQTGTETVVGMIRPSDNEFGVSGAADAPAFAQDYEMSQTEIEQYWQATR
jgi:hypothetical protein